MPERCVCCGEIIPEGRQACPNCLVHNVAMDGVVHGRWEDAGKNIHGQKLTRCSRCKGNSIEGGLFCRNCGAKMDLPNITDQTMDALLKMGRNVHGGAADG